MTWAVAAATYNKTDWAALHAKAWLFLIASGLMTGLSWLCYFRAR